MSISVPCNFSVYIDEFLCSCEGIAKFSEETPFVWYKGRETDYFLIWNITINADTAERIQVAVKRIRLEPIFKNQLIEGIRSNLIDSIFQNRIKNKLLNLSMSNFVWDKFSRNIYDKYFPNGLEIALRDISGAGLSWRRDCQEYEKYYQWQMKLQDPEYLKKLNEDFN